MVNLNRDKKPRLNWSRVIVVLIIIILAIIGGVTVVARLLN